MRFSFVRPFHLYLFHPYGLGDPDAADDDGDDDDDGAFCCYCYTEEKTTELKDSLAVVLYVVKIFWQRACLLTQSSLNE